jgi:hypothetical protein
MTKPPKTPRPPKPPIKPAHPNHVPDPTIGLIQQKLIGRVIVEWAKLEACMGDAIHKLAGIEFEVGRIFTARLDAVTLLKTLRELGSLQLPESEFHQLSTICDKINIRRDDRNLITHGTWGRTKGQNDAFAVSLRIKSDDPSDVVSETFPHRRMKEITSDILSLKWDLIGLMKLREPLGTRYEPPPSE